MLVTLDLQAILYTKYAHISMNFHPRKYQASGSTNSLDIAKWKRKRSCPSIFKYVLCIVSTKYYLIENYAICYRLLRYIVSDYNSRPKSCLGGSRLVSTPFVI